MDELLRSFEGKKVELFCGMNSLFSGVLETVGAGFVTVKDSEERTVHIARDKIVAVREGFEHQSRPGFIA